jgi:hypothetical protein
VRNDVRVESSDSMREIFKNIKIDDLLNENISNDNNNDSNDNENVAALEESASTLRKSEHLRKAFKLIEKIIEYDSKKKQFLN